MSGRQINISVHLKNVTVSYMQSDSFCSETQQRKRPGSTFNHNSKGILSISLLFTNSYCVRRHRTALRKQINSWRVLLASLGWTCCDGDLCRCSWEEFWPTYSSVIWLLNQITDGGAAELCGSGARLSVISPARIYIPAIVRLHPSLVGSSLMLV